jgi:hypothetical protein
MRTCEFTGWEKTLSMRDLRFRLTDNSDDSLHGIELYTISSLEKLRRVLDVSQCGKTVFPGDSRSVRQNASDLDNDASCERKQWSPRGIRRWSDQDRAALHLREFASVVQDDEFRRV